MSKELLIKNGGLKELSKCNLKDLYIPGIKKAKASKILAVFEIARRIYVDNQISLYNQKIINSSQVYKMFSNKIINNIKETFIVILLDSHKRLINSISYSNDIDDQVNLTIKKIIKYCIEKNCTYVYLMHNHPSNSLIPSEQDKNSTLMLSYSLKMVGINLIEHLVVTKDGFYEILNEQINKIS